MEKKTIRTIEEEQCNESEVVSVDGALVDGIEDLIRDILLRLPWQSLTRFKSVSKKWRRLVSDPCFIKDYQFRNFVLLGFLHINFKRVKFVPFPLLEKPICIRDLNTTSSSSSPPFRILGIKNLSNGLVLCCYRFYKQTSRLGSYVVYNPITEEQLYLPPEPRPFGKAPSDGQSIFRVTGFAFHKDSDTSFLIVTKMVNRKNGLQVDIYTSETFKWKSKLYDLRPMFGGIENYALSGPSTFYRGSLHWVSEPLGVVSYCAKTLRFAFRRLPTNGDDPQTPCHCRFRYLGECLDKLFYIQIAGDSQLYLWKLEDYNRGKWSQRQLIIVENVPMPLIHGSIVSFDRRDDQVFFLKMKRLIFSYNLRSKELTMLHEVPLEDDDDSDLNFFWAYELPKSVTFLNPTFLNCLAARNLSHLTKPISRVSSGFEISR